MCICSTAGRRHTRLALLLEDNDLFVQFYALLNSILSYQHVNDCAAAFICEVLLSGHAFSFLLRHTSGHGGIDLMVNGPI